MGLRNIYIAFFSFVIVLVLKDEYKNEQGSYITVVRIFNK